MNRKKALIFGLITCLLVSLSGCVRVRASIKIKLNGKADVSVLLAANASMQSAEYGINLFSDDTVDEYKANGYEAEPYSEDGYTGYIFSKSNTSLKEGVLNNPASLHKEGQKYVLDILIEGNEQSSYAGMAALIASQGGFAELVITLPCKPINHNATSVSKDGKTLTWNLLSLGDRASIHVEYSVVTLYLLLALYLILAVVLVVIIIKTVMRIIGKAKERQEKSHTPTRNYGNPYRLFHYNEVTNGMSEIETLQIMGPGYIRTELPNGYIRYSWFIDPAYDQEAKAVHIILYDGKVTRVESVNM